MREAEKRATGWERFREYVRKHPWRIVRRTLLILLFCAYCAYTSVQLLSPNRYYIFLHDSFSEHPIYRKRTDVEVDFTETDIADQPELQAEICERLTPTKDYTFHVNEEAPIMHYFSGACASVTKGKGTRYTVHIITMNIHDLNGQTVSSGPMAAYSFTYYYNPFLMRWKERPH